MTELIELLTNNGIGIVCVAFLIYFINTTMKENNTILDNIKLTLVEINDSIQMLSHRVDDIEQKINRKE